MNVLDSIFAKLYDRLTEPMEQRGLAEQRRQLLGSLTGDVLEVGAGTGRNTELYPGTVASLTLTEPSPPMVDKLREQVAKVSSDATVVTAPAEDLPFDDSSFDAVVTTLVLCSVDDLDAAITELHRVLRPDGRLVLIEHVATSGGPSTLQRVWDPVQHVLGRNCHLTRDTRSALNRVGFDTSGVLDGVLPGAPASMFPVITGIAVPVAS